MYFIIIQVILHHILLYFIFYIVIGFEKPFFLENLIKYVCMYVCISARYREKREIFDWIWVQVKLVVVVVVNLYLNSVKKSSVILIVF